MVVSDFVEQQPDEVRERAARGTRARHGGAERADGAQEGETGRTRGAHAAARARAAGARVARPHARRRTHKTSPPALTLSDPLAGPIILYMSD